MQRGNRPPAPPSDPNQRPTRTLPKRTIPRPKRDTQPPRDDQQPHSQTMPRPSGPPPLRSSPNWNSRQQAQAPASPTGAYAHSPAHSVPPFGAASAPARDSADQEIERLGQQVVELLERVRVAEERTAYAEQQLTHMTHMANAAAAAAVAAPARAAEYESVRTRSSGLSWIPWAAVGLVTALAVAGYVLGYLPLREQFETQVKQNLEQSTQHSQALKTAENRFIEERDRLQSQLAAAQAAAATAASASSTDAEQPEAKQTSSGSSSSGSEDRAAAAEERAARAEARRAEREARREERAAKRAERAAERAERAAKRKEAAGASDDEDDEPATPEPKLSKPAESAAPGDDPLEGLDGDGL